MFARSINVDLEKLAKASEEQPAGKKRVAARGRPAARKPQATAQPVFAMIAKSPRNPCSSMNAQPLPWPASRRAALGRGVLRGRRQCGRCHHHAKGHRHISAHDLLLRSRRRAPALRKCQGARVYPACPRA